MKKCFTLSARLLIWFVLMSAGFGSLNAQSATETLSEPNSFSRNAPVRITYVDVNSKPLSADQFVRKNAGLKMADDHSIVRERSKATELSTLKKNDPKPYSYFLGTAQNANLGFQILKFAVDNAADTIVEAVYAGCPFSGNGAVLTGYYLYPSWSVWNGKEYIGYWLARQGNNPLQGLGYYAYNPATQTMSEIGSTKLEGANWQPYASTYNFSDHKIYIIQRVANAGTNPLTYSMILASSSGTDTIFTKGATITGMTAAKYIVGLACTKEGTMYAINEDGYLYTINISTGVASKVGPIGVTTTSGYAQSMSMDHRSGKLYWQGVYIEGSSAKVDFFTVNTTTGVATGSNGGIQVTGFASMFHPVPYIGNVTDLSLILTPTNSKEINVNFTVPSLDINDDPVVEANKASKAFIYKLENKKWVVKKTISEVTSGQKISEKMTESAEGTFLYGVSILGVDGKSSDTVFAEVTCMQVDLPYANSFEASETEAQKNLEVIKGNNNAVLITESAHAYAGSNSYRLSDMGGSLNFKAIPVEKGGFYEVSCWFKSKTIGSNGAWLYLLLDGKQATYKYAKVSNKYEAFSYLYEAKNSGQTTFSFLANYMKDTVYVDSVAFKLITPSTVPGIVQSLDIEAAELGALKAKVSFKTPALDQGGNTLSDITKVTIYYGTSSVFPFGNLKVDVDIIDMDKDTTIEVPVPANGNYYFGLVTHNSHGESAYYFGGTGSKTYIGSDKPKAPASIAVKTEAGKVLVEWNPSTEGTNGGYISEDLTYLLIYKCGTEQDSVKAIVDTTYVFEDGLALDYYQFQVKAINGDMVSDARSTYKLVSLSDQQVVLAEPTGAGSTSTTYPLAMGTTTNGKQSALTQSIYQANGKAMYIDKLNLLTYATTDTIHQRYVVYIGSKDSNAFANSKDWVNPATLTKVFDGILESSTTTRVSTIPISGFYYDGETPMLVQIIKPARVETGNNWSTYTSLTPVDANYGTLYKSSNEADFEALENYDEHTSLLASGGYVPALYVDKAQNLSTVTGVITNSVGAFIEAKIGIQSHEDNANTLAAKLKSDDKGSYTFAFLPLGKVNLNIQALGYLTIDTTIMVETASSTITLNLKMQSTVAIKVSGIVKNEAGDVLEDVTVKAKSVAELTATTDALGAYSFDLYGSTAYTFSFEKAGMKTVSVNLIAEDRDTVLEDVAMEYIPYNLVWVDAQLNAQKQMVINWHAPATLKNQAWSGTDSLKTALTNGGSAFRVAHRYTKEDIATLNLKGKKIAKMGFLPSDASALYTIKICADTNTVLYSRSLEIYEWKMSHWNDFAIPADIVFPEDKEIWFILEVAAGYLNHPIAFGGSPAVPNKGDLISIGNTWMRVSTAVPTLLTNCLIRFTVEEDIKDDAPNGYAVYVGKKDDNFSAYTKLTTDNVKTNTYTHATFSALAAGEYRYAVRGDYYNQRFSDPAFSGVVGKEMFRKVEVTITANSGSAQGALFTMVNKDNPIYFYEAKVNAEGKVSFPKVFKGIYKVTTTLPFHEPFAAEYTVDADLQKTIALKELVANPYIISAEVSGKDVTMKFSANHAANWFDDVESYQDFAIDNVGEWIMANKKAKGGVDKTSWPNAQENQAYIVMNPAKTTPAMTGVEWSAHSGTKYLCAMFATQKPNNDMLIRQVENGGGTLSFAVFGIGYNAPEQFKVMYSETDATPASFKVIPGTGTISAPTSWAQASYKVPETAKYIAINCVSNDQFALKLDDIGYSIGTQVKPKGYEIYLDGVKVATLGADTSSYKFENLAVGSHTVGVKSVFKSGASEMTSETVTISAFAVPTDLSVAVSTDKKEAIFTYAAPTGFTPVRYRIFLDDVLKDSTTATTYTFTNLTAAAHEAGVVAVYADGVSEQAKISFTTVGIEDLEGQESVMAYPNPSSDGIFNVVLIEPSTIEVVNAKGQPVLRQVSPVQGTYVVDLSNSAKGVYYILIYAGQERTKVLKVISR